MVNDEDLAECLSDADNDAGDIEDDNDFEGDILIAVMGIVTMTMTIMTVLIMMAECISKMEY